MSEERPRSDPNCEVSFCAGDGCDAQLDCATLARVFSSLVKHFARPIARVDARIVGDAAMDAAHQQFSGIAGTTDGDASDCAAVEVDLIICSDAASREATLRGHPIERELLLYAVHGTLHACGWRDDEVAAAALMHVEEDRILRAGGIGVVYACNADRPDRGNTAPETPTA